MNQTPVSRKPEQQSPMVMSEKQRIADLMLQCAKSGPVAGDGGWWGAVHYMVQCCGASKVTVNFWHYRAL